MASTVSRVLKKTIESSRACADIGLSPSYCSLSNRVLPRSRVMVHCVVPPNDYGDRFVASVV